LRAPNAFKVVGLPAGLTVSTSGLISGKPTVAVTDKPITITASNTAGASGTVNTTLTILAIPANAQGTFVGLVERNPGVGSNLGARLDLTTTPLGGFTAKLLVDGKTVTGTGTGSLVGTVTPPATLASLTGKATFTRAGLSTLELNVAINFANNTVTGTVKDLTTGATAALSGYRNVWHATSNKATKYKDGYTFGLEIPLADNGDLEVPQGNGIGSFKVGDDGKLTCAGSTADGLGYSSAGFVGPTGDVMVYAPFTTSVGSLAGTAHITEDGASYVNNTFTGTLSWSKNAAPAASTNQAYRAGFTPRDLTIIGGKYKAPAPGGVVMAMNNTVNDNARLSFAEGGLVAGQANPQVFTIRNTGAALVQTITMPKYNAALPVNPNPNMVTFALAAAPLGQFSGSLTVFHPVTTLNRTAKFTGMIVWTGSAYSAQGYFLLSQLPQSGQTLTTSPVLSGQVVLEKAVP
jgi:hypothetical protein